ncbi:MerR family transcriptional regulator [Actinoalloteichus spitiensis]|uniref:MerR family transcriptional regulator n=1 Tax=Actinoalloteichus spitiensis TaxID=252394 RepID=UPI003CCAB6DA
MADSRSPEPLLTVAAVARRLGVAPATLRTWDRRYGLGPSGHTAGRHRRYGPLDLARLELMQHALLRGASPREAARYALASALPVQAAAESGHDVRQVPGRGSRTAAERRRSEPAPASEQRAGPGAMLVSGQVVVPEFVERVRVGGKGLRLPGASRRARGLGRAVLAMDLWSVNRLLLEGIESDGVLTTWREIAAPVLAALQERREHTGEGIEASRLLSTCVISTVSTVIARAQPPRNPRAVLLAGAPGEPDALPLFLVTAELSSRRIGTQLLGADLPLDGLVAAVRRTAPAVAVLWATMPRCGDPEIFQAVPRTRQPVRLFAGGAGWEESSLPPRVRWVSGVQETVDAIERVVGDS